MQLSSLLGHTRELLLQIRSTGRPADILIDSFFRSRRYLGSHDRRFVAETTYGTLRHLRWSETVAESGLGAEINGLSNEERLLFTIVVYHVHKAGNSIPTVADLKPLLKSEPSAEALNGFLASLKARSVPPDLTTQFSVRHSLPDWLADRLLETYGREEAANLCESLNTQAPLNLRVNTLKTTVSDCVERLRKEGVEARPGGFSPVGLTVSKRLNIFRLQAFRDGLFEVQDEGSQLVGILLDPKPTWKVLDACAGAGGKSLHLAAIMKNRGEIIAADVHDRRIGELRRRAARAGASNIRMMLTDDLVSREQYDGFFDTVFLDVPCSGTGTLRRNPGLKWSLKESDLSELKTKQIHILEAHKRFVKPEGMMFYATCSLLRDENEDVVDAFLAANSDFERADLEEYAQRTGMEKFVTGNALRLLPHLHGTDGFFCAALRKRHG
ncbi:MAG: NOL1/NOP2/Sun family protein [Bacteroidia bacterium]|nr:MAG: NOL1/NOP2/Sun family protein [Bacteroidia bacterium]